MSHPWVWDRKTVNKDQYHFHDYESDVSPRELDSAAMWSSALEEKSEVMFFIGDTEMIAGMISFQ